MGFGPAAQTLDVRAEHQPVEQRRGEVERRADRQGVTALQYPAVTLADGNPAMPAGVTEQRNQVHLWLERQADGLQPQPVRIYLLVKDPARLVGEIGGVISQLEPCLWPPHGLVLTPVNVNLRLRKVRQTAGMVEMQVGQDDVFNLAGRDAKPGQLPDGCAFGVEGNAKSQPVEAHQPPGGAVVVQPQPGIHEGQPLPGFNQQGCAARPPARKGRRHRSAVKHADGHKNKPWAGLPEIGLYLPGKNQLEGCQVKRGLLNVYCSTRE